MRIKSHIFLSKLTQLLYLLPCVILLAFPNQVNIVLTYSVLSFFTLLLYIIERDLFAPNVVYPLLLTSFFLVGGILLEDLGVERAIIVPVILGTAGFMLGCFLSPLPRRAEASLLLVPPHKQYAVVTFYFFIVGLVGLIGIVVQVGVPVLSDELKVYRIDMQSTIRYFGLINLMFNHNQMLLLLSGSYLMLDERYAQYKIAALMCFLFSMAALSMFGNRGLLVFPLLGLAIIYNYIYARIYLIKFVLGLSVGLFFIGAVGYYRESYGYNWTFENALDRAIHEVSVPAFNLDMVLRIVPNSLDFMYGAGMLAPLTTLLPGKQLLLDHKLKSLSGLDFEGGGLPATIVGSFYIDFGYFGVLIFMILLGVVLTKLRNTFLENTNLISLFIYAYLLQISIASMRNMLALDILYLSNIAILLTFAARAKGQMVPLANRAR